VAVAELTVDQLDPTYPARARLSKMLNLPYIASGKQLEFHLAPNSTQSQPLLFGGAMGGGKSAAICAEAIRECIEVPRNRVLMARLELVNFKNTTLTTLLPLIPPDAEHRPSVQMFVFKNGSTLHYTGLGTEKERQKLRSAEYGAIFIDEATQIDHKTFLEAGTRLRWGPAAQAGRLKMRLTCNPEPGWIKDDFVAMPKPGYSYIQALPSDNPHLHAGYIQEMKEQLPPEWFAAYMRGDWDAFTPQTVVLSAMLLDEATRRPAVLDPMQDIIWSVDVARFGDDSTVLAFRSGLTFGLVTSPWQKAPIDETVANIVTLYQTSHPKPSAINVDDDGVGGGVTDGLKKAQREGLLGACIINPVIVQTVAEDPVHYDRLKAELWFRFKALLESGAPVSLPAKPPEIRQDLEAHRYDVRGGKAIVEPKPILKRRLGRSPDMGDAIILLMYQKPGMYIAYQTPEEALRRQLESLSEDQRRLYLTDLDRKKKAQQRLANFQQRFGVAILPQDETGY
jgi:phage terminase large subunit